MTNQEQKSRPFTAKSIMNLLVGSFFLLTFNSEAQIKTYEVVFNSSAPVLDGVRSPGEWDKASEAASDFKLLRTGGTESSENIQFQLLWNDEGLYMIAETDNTSWGDWGGNVDFGFDDYNIFIDPNDDDEPNEGPFDGYQIAIWQTNGLISRFADELDDQERTTFLEARHNGNFGNNAGWAEPRELNWVSNHGDFGGVVELFIPWTDFNADEFGENGLYHPQAPEFDDVWYFNIAKIASSGALPTWNWTSGQFFAVRPHGEITFTGARVPFIITEFGPNDDNAKSNDITWNSVSGKIYGVDFSNDMIEWEELDDGIEGNDEKTTFTHEDAPEGKKGFYRVRLLE
ncbi:MAG: hypothetical protein CBC36_06070 [Verrucomicrobiaceae bacterium TMED76]|nr:MAG: hypothetical protein CBC36_06070 [Verrucomicrobiaceae bacterium TMED76]